MDPRRANRLRHPVARLYGEYIWGYVSAIRRAPLSAAERQECYRVLGAVDRRPSPARWPERTVSRSGLQAGEPVSAAPPGMSIDAVVAGRPRRTS